MRIASVLFASLVAAGAAGCGGSSSSSPPPAHPSPGASDDRSCPVAVLGTSVSVEDTNRGAALVFVTTGDVDEVRKRVAAMAAMHSDHHSSMGALPTGDEDSAGHDHGGHAGHDMGGMEHGEAGGAHGAHAGGMISVHSQATVEEIEGGARLVLTAMPDDVGALQSELRTHAQHLSTGTCAMGHH